MMRLSDVSARYDVISGYVNAVDHVSFQIDDNEIFGIAGESGCGKSTLLKVMYDLISYPLEISNGQVLLTGRDEAGRKTYHSGEIRNRWWKDISYIPQGAMHVHNPVARIDTQFFDAIDQTIWPNKKELRHAIDEYLREMDLPPEVMDAYPHQLSGGMRQRVLIALATFISPSLVLADEPTTALDVVVQRAILGMLLRVQRKTNNSMVLVSHDMGVHYQITDRVGIMYAGQMIELGATRDIFEHPAHPYTQMLIDALPRIGDLRPKEGIPGSPPSLKKPPEGCRFRARCNQSQPGCEVQPAMCDIGNGHKVSCHLYRCEEVLT